MSSPYCMILLPYHNCLAMLPTLNITFICSSILLALTCRILFCATHSSICFISYCMCSLWYSHRNCTLPTYFTLSRLLFARACLGLYPHTASNSYQPLYCIFWESYDLLSFLRLFCWWTWAQALTLLFTAHS